MNSSWRKASVGLVFLGVALVVAFWISRSSGESEVGEDSVPTSGTRNSRRFPSGSSDFLDKGSNRRSSRRVASVEIKDRYSSVKKKINDYHGTDIVFFEDALTEILAYPEPYKSILLSNLFDNFSNNALQALDLSSPSSVSFFFKFYNKISRMLGDTRFDNRGELQKLFMKAVVANLNVIPDYPGIDSFISAVDAADFHGREKLYIGAYVAKITAENAHPDLDNIPRTGDPFLDRNLHIGLFEAYAVVDRSSALQFFLADEFLGGSDFENVPNIAGSFAVRNWDRFVELLSKSDKSEKISVLVNGALRRQEVQSSREKKQFLEGYLD